MEPKPPISIKNYKEKKKEIISYIFLNIKLVLFKMFLNKKNVLIFLVIFFSVQFLFSFFFFIKNHHFLYQNLKKINIEMMQNSENGENIFLNIFEDSFSLFMGK